MTDRTEGAGSICAETENRYGAEEGRWDLGNIRDVNYVLRGTKCVFKDIEECRGTAGDGRTHSKVNGKIRNTAAFCKTHRNLGNRTRLLRIELVTVV